MTFELSDIASSTEDSYKSRLETIAQKLYTITKENKSIERRIKTFEQLDQIDRINLRESLQKTSDLSKQLQKNLSDFDITYLKTGSTVKKAKTAFENSSQAFTKECKKLEELTSQLIMKEKYVLEKCRQTQEYNFIAKPELEKKGLLEDDDHYRVETKKTSSNDFLRGFVVKHQDDIEIERQEKITEVCDSIQNVFFILINR